MQPIDQASPEQLRQQLSLLNQQFQQLQQQHLDLDLTRGKPSPAQLDLSQDLDGILKGNYRDSSGTDLRNYGGLDGIAEAKALFSTLAGVQDTEILIGGNSSLTLMYFCAQTALDRGLGENHKPWRQGQLPVKFLAPVPGYDRHFSLCQHLGIELIPVAMNDAGPDMDQVETLLRADSSIKGIWCVPRFSNPSGIVYSDDVVQRVAKLGKIAGENFLVFWDNAYAVHSLDKGAPQLANIMNYCRAEGTEDSVLLFGSTSKITLAGAGVAFVAGSPSNLTELKRHLAFMSIGPDKINQLRHVKFLRDASTIEAHMQKHAAIMKPRFDAVLQALNTSLGNHGLGEWTEPRGGYFVSFDSRPGLAREIVKLAAQLGVKLTPAGATFPGGNDPRDCNIRLAPSYPSVEEINKAMEVFVTCVKLASVRQQLNAG